ncbi:predicted protein [Streptomyces iranensis]|uniref:Uncharacterized protein n=1 Tax=Streptomyces iranensis TaxID=576784 RepID=A0A060ZGD2_9ACTN|nr:predicted protein [Streptomyces iranensis]
MDEGEADQWRPGEIEPRGAVLGQPPVERGGAPLLGKVAEIQLVPDGGDSGRHHLHGLGQSVVMEGRGQVRMATQQGVRRPPEACAADLPFEVEGELHEIDVRGRLVVHGVEQQSALERGQRQQLRGVGGVRGVCGLRRQGGALRRQARVFGRGEGHQGPRLSGGELLRRGRRVVPGVGDGSEALRRPVPEDLPRCEDESLRAGAADQPHGEDTVATQVEEALVRAYIGDAEHLAEESTQPCLQRCGRRPSRSERGEVGRGEGRAVELAVRGERHPVEGDDRRGHHMGGQPLAEIRAERGDHRTRPVCEAGLVGVGGGGTAGCGGGRCGDVEGGDADSGGGGGAEVDEHTVETPFIGRPAQCQVVAVRLGEPMERFRVRLCVRLGAQLGVRLRPRAVVPGRRGRRREVVPGVVRVGTGVETVQGGELAGQPGVGDTGHPQRSWAVVSRQRVAQVVHRTDVLTPPQMWRTVGGEQCDGSLGEDDVVAVPGELVARRAAFDADVDGAYGGHDGCEGGEVLRVHQEFPLQADGVVHRGAQALRRGPRGRLGEGDRGGEAAQQAKVAYVPDEQLPAGLEDRHGMGDDIGQVVDVREVLDDGVDDDGVEASLGQRAEVMRRPALERHPAVACAQLGILRHALIQGSDGGGRDVGAPVARTVRSQT